MTTTPTCSTDCGARGRDQRGECLGGDAQRDVVPAVGGADDDTDGDDEDVQQLVSAALTGARVFHVGEKAQYATWGVDVHAKAPARRDGLCPGVANGGR